MNTESIFSGIWALAAKSEGFRTKQRRFKHWDNVEDTPFLCMEQEALDLSGEPGLAYEGVFRANLYIYVTEDDPNKDPSIKLNCLVDYVSAQFKLEDLTVQTLGGIAQYCKVTEVSYYPGFLGNKGIAILSVESKGKSETPVNWCS